MFFSPIVQKFCIMIISYVIVSKITWGIQFYIIKNQNNNNNTKIEKKMSYHLIINLKAFL